MTVYKLTTLFLVLNIAFQLISDITAAKIILIFGFGVSVTVLYFPFTYIISDIITEVYGYAKSRQILWFTLLASVIAGIFYQLVIMIPSAPFFLHNDAYETVFSIVPRVLIGGWLAVFCGEISNNYILAKLKIFTNGKLLWFRTISSTIIGQFINTVVFYIIALWDIIPMNMLIEGILAGWVIKTCIEILLTPLTYIIINKVKRMEGVDKYDTKTNFNPFKVKL